MKKLIYLIFGICLSAFSDNADLQSEYSHYQSHELQIVDGSCNQDFAIPRESNLSNVSRVLSSGKRTNSVLRHNFSFVKDGKMINRRSTVLLLHNFFLFPSGLTETQHHLISLGKLII